MRLWPYLAHFFLQQEILQRNILWRKSKQTYYVQCGDFNNRAVCKIMWENIVEPGKPQMAKRRMRIASRVTKDTNTHPECVMLIVFQLQQWLNERPLMLCYTYSTAHCVSCVCCRREEVFGGGAYEDDDDDDLLQLGCYPVAVVILHVCKT